MFSVLILWRERYVKRVADEEIRPKKSEAKAGGQQYNHAGGYGGHRGGYR